MISQLIAKWSRITAESKIVIVTDPAQERLARAIAAEGAYDVQTACFDPEQAEALFIRLRALTPRDLVMVAVSFDTFVTGGANRYFSPFGKPEGVSAQYIFIRLGISRDSLAQGLSTDKERVYGKLGEMAAIPDGAALRVTNGSGTDLTLRVHTFTTCDHEITEEGGMAFLPPSETSSEVIPGSARGKIVIDTTVGQLYHFTDLLGYFGLVDTPVTLWIEDGFIRDITGGDMARELKEKLFALEPDCRKLVELGQGLSQMEPTGLIGVDESILDSCHFGFGDGGSCGVHLDMVIARPTIMRV